MPHRPSTSVPITFWVSIAVVLITLSLLAGHLAPASASPPSASSTSPTSCTTSTETTSGADATTGRGPAAIALSRRDGGSSCPEDDPTETDPGDGDGETDAPDADLPDQDVPSDEPSDEPSDDGVRPAYAAHSPWNTPIPDDAPVHPDTDVFVDSFRTAHRDGHQRPLTSDPTQYSYPLHRVSAEDEVRPVTLRGVYSEVVDETTTRMRPRITVDVPVPADAQPSPGTDASIIIWDPETGDEWGFWEFANEGDGTFSAQNGYHYNTRWSAVPPTSPDRFISRGAGLPYLAGLVRRDEVDAGRIDHALAFAYDYPSPEAVFPATKSDGWGDPATDVPEGARIRLDPDLTEEDFDRWGLSREGRIIARALQRYGMYTIDRAGRPKIMIEDEATAGWGGSITASTVSAIPWESFEVLDWRAPRPPMAVLPRDRTVAIGSLVQLDGRASYDPDGEGIVAYDWIAPDGVELPGASSATPSWDTAGHEPGAYTFELHVQDAAGTWSEGAARVTHTLEPPARPTIFEAHAFGGVHTDQVSGGSWSPRPGEELLTVVAMRPARAEVDEVIGNGLAWERVVRHRDAQGELAVEVWRAAGAAPTTGAVTVATTQEAWALNTQTLRLSPSRISHAAGADTGPSDTARPSLALAAPDGPSLRVGVHVGRATPFTLDAGLEEVARHAVGEAGNNVRTTTMVSLDAGPDPAPLGGTQSSALDWVMAGVTLEFR